MQMIHVTWLDSCEPVDNADLALHEMPKPQLLFQVGFLLIDTPEHIVVASGVKPALQGQAEDSYDYAIAIPRCSIKEINTLEISETEKSL